MKRIVAGVLVVTSIGGYALAQSNNTQSAAAPKSWADTITFKGDLRYRYDYLKDDSKTPSTEQRDRIRARIGAYAKPNDEVDVGVRLATATSEGGSNGTPLSNNTTLTSAGSKKEAFFDAAYLDYHPGELKGLDLIAGKMEIPYYRVADNVFDNDYTPEGLAAKYKLEIADDVQFMLNGAYHWLNESATTTDGKQSGVQAIVRGGHKDNYVLAGVGYYATTSLKNHNVLDNTGANRSFGNTTSKVVSGSTTNSVYPDEFSVVEGFVEAGTSALGGFPAKAYGSYTENSDAPSDKNGWVSGVQVGKVTTPGTWEIGYNYRDLEKNAVLGAIVDDDAGGGGTNYKGHKITAGVGLLKNLQFNVSFFDDKKDPSGSNKSYDRVFVDLLAKF